VNPWCILRAERFGPAKNHGTAPVQLFATVGFLSALYTTNAIPAGSPDKVRNARLSIKSEPKMLRSWKLGTAFGIGIYVHWTFILLPAWVFFSNWGEGPIAVALYLVLLTFGIFGCIVLHELGHALMARYFGIPTRDITLYPIGGVARLERMSDRPWEEFSIAVAGPAVNVAIAGILGVVLSAAGAPLLLHDNLEVGNLGAFGFHLLAANLFLALFNLIPAFPMDGGRILRALLAVRLGQLRATEIAAGLGVGISLLFFILAILNGTPGLFLLALFVFLLGQQELAMIRWRAAGRQPAGAPREEYLDAAPVTDAVYTVRQRPADPHFTGFTWDPRAQLWVQWRDGRAVQAVSVESDVQP
jgi:Zn-dependent protease